jgi:hypothetical protein
MMTGRVIVAGKRDADRDQARILLRRGFEHQGLHPDEIEAVATGESGEVDKLGRLWAEYHGVHYQPFPAWWDTEGKAAGPLRNERMAKWAAEKPGGTLVAVWDGKSKGTQDMILAAHRHGLTVEVQLLEQVK